MIDHAEVYDIHRAFKETEFGDELSQRVRYDKYRPSHISEAEWVDLLGADVNNLTHLPLTYGIARAFINHAREEQPELLNTDEEKLLLVAAITHDWAESITTDISFGDKTAQDDNDERAAFEEYIDQFYDGDDAELVDVARREIIFDHTSKLGELFNAVERVGYLRTALRANDIVLGGVDDPQLEAGLQWLVFDVMSNLQSKDDLDSPPRILEMQKFAPVAAYIESVRERIEAALDASLQCMEDVLPKYSGQGAQKREQLVYCVQNWDNYWSDAA